MPAGPENNITSKYQNTFFYLFILLIGAAIAYWPISFYVFSLKNDALNYFLPIRRLVSESYHLYTLPLWSPYVNLGYPLHGDMQSGVWNPVVQLFSLFGTYTLYTLQAETVLYIFLSGAGMFFLLKYFKVHPYSNLIASFAYMLCGFGSDSAQYLLWIAGLSFLPFVFLFYYRCLEEKSIRMAMYTGTFVFFLFNCAYPADFIITMYLMLGMFIWHLAIQYKVQKKIILSTKFLLAHLILLLVFLILSGPAILSYAQALPLSERGAGASYAQVMSNALHPALISSYTTPLAPWFMPGVSITGATERNSYIGIFSFILALGSFLIRTDSKIVRFCKYASLIFLLFSFGEMGGIRILLYYTLPLMDSFRHPANAKMFTTFFFCLLAAFTFDAFIRNEIKKQVIKTGMLIAIFLSLVVFLWSCLSSGHSVNALPGKINSSDRSLSQSIKQLLDSMSFFQATLLNIIIQLPFLVLLWQYTIKKTRPFSAMILAITNSILFCILFQPFTVVKNDKASRIQSLIENVAVQGYPLPDINTSIADNSLTGMKYFDEIGTLNLYNKKVGRIDYFITPCNLITQDEFWANVNLRELVFNYPIIYRSDSALTSTNKVTINSLSAHKKYVFTESTSLADSINNYNPRQIASIGVKSFVPNNFSFIISSNSKGYYVLLQNYFPLWSIHVDGNIVKPDKVNTSFMGFNLSEGRHVVEFKYEAMHIVITFWISAVALLGILLYSISDAIKTKK